MEVKNFNIVSFLRENNYQVTENSNYITIPAKWRGGSDITSVTGYLNKNLFIDWVTGDKFDINGLIKRVLNLPDEKNVKEYLAYNKIQLPTNDGYNLKNEIKIMDIFPEEVKDLLVPDYSYWVGRGISEETAKQFENGKVLTGAFKNRQTFIIRNSKKQIVGLSGRDLIGDKKAKWRHSGSKSNFVFPALINSKIIKEKGEVLLVESVGDVLACYEAGIKNVLCVFGIDLGLGVLNYLLRISPNKINICLNNDNHLNGAGNEGAIKMKKKLDKYFDHHISKICEIPSKDMNDFLVEKGRDEVIKWYNQI